MLFKIAPVSLNPQKTHLSLLSPSSHASLSLLSLSSPLLSSHASLSLLSLSILHLSSPLNSLHNALTTQRQRRICAGETTSVSRLRRRRSDETTLFQFVLRKPHRSRILQRSSFTPPSLSSFVLRLCGSRQLLFCNCCNCCFFCNCCYYNIFVIICVGNYY